jgi:hypothetical protein
MAKNCQWPMVNEQPRATSSGWTICGCLRLIDHQSDSSVPGRLEGRLWFLPMIDR